jgi:hypothetical protein
MAIDPDKPIPQDGRVNPAALDVTAKPKRKRRARNRPKPSLELSQWAAGAEVRAHSRPHPPGIILEPAGFDKEHWTSPHSDPDLWTLQLAEAFGTRSRAVISTFMSQLAALCGEKEWDDEARQWRLDENEYSAALAMVSSIKPKSEMEAALAAQMVAIHLLQMKVAARAIKFDYDTKTAAVAGKLARTFTMQLDSLQRLRGRQKTTRQSIRVTKELHQHVHYHRGDVGTHGQPQATPAVQPEELPALPSPDEGGEVVPLASRRGKKSV